MRRLLLVTCASLFAAAPSVAQDVLGPVNPVDYTGAMAAQSAANAQARRPSDRTSARRSSASRTARTCANVPAVRARLGADDPKVQELARLCRRAGY
ncbi:hypothetical protein [Sphingomonas lenta]|uniref:UrcA family protein n=1 Tax=Sphingomonas lenta TaxID=1141887 RepID=A0A2A2SCE3_9SPHN|nr:hypothetical protein [Sphingomonas lenta]PAX06974.1 hypothetical protein CKY28_12970 [Sphingomonas lenta]